MRGDLLPLVCQAERGGEQPEHARGLEATLGQLPQGDRAVALGQARSVGSQHDRHVRPVRALEPQQVVEQGLARGGGEQVVAAHDLADPLLGVVDLMLAVQQVVGRTYVAMPVYVVGAMLYFAVNYTLSSLSRLLETRFAEIRE